MSAFISELLSQNNGRAVFPALLRSATKHYRRNSCDLGPHTYNITSWVNEVRIIEEKPQMLAVGAASRRPKVCKGKPPRIIRGGCRGPCSGPPKLASDGDFFTGRRSRRGGSAARVHRSVSE